MVPIGHATAYNVIDDIEARAIVSPGQGAKISRHGNAKVDRPDREGNLRNVQKKGRVGCERDSGYY